MEEALRERDSRLTSVFRAAPVGIGLVSNRVLVEVNGRLCEMTGYRREELIGRNSRMLYPTQEDWEYVGREKYRQIHERGTGSVETRWQRKDGRVIDVLLSSTPLDPEDLARGVTFTALDITDRKRTEKALRFTQFAVNHTADGAFWMTEDGRFCYVNEAACRALGYTCEELMRMTVFDIDPSFTEKMWSDSWRQLKAKKSIILETVHRARDGRVYPVEIRANYVEFGGRQYDCAFVRDITERKRAEEALRESEERFRTAFEAGPVAMALTAMDTTLLKVNASFCRMLGFSESELVGRSYTEITHPEDIAANLVGTRRLASGEISSFRVEKRYIRKDGVVVWADMNTAAVPDAQGRPLYCVTHIQDITERKQAEEALRRSEARLSRSQEIAHLGSWELDLARDELAWSDEVYRIFGLQPQEFGATYEAFLECVHPDDRQAVDDAYRGSVREGRDTYEIEHRIVRKDTGEVRIVHEKCEHFRDAAGGIVRSVGMVHDITERTRAEEALRQSEARHRRLIENLKGSHFVYVHDTEGVFQYASESLTDILGYAPDEFLTHYEKYLTDHPANQAVRRHTELALQGIRQPPYEVNTWHKDGSTRWLEVQEVPVFDAEGRVIAVEGVAQDITERKQAAEALRESEERHRFLVESVNDWIWETDRNGVYTYASPQCREMLGYEPREIVGKTPFDLMPPEEAGRVREIFVAVASQAKPFRRLENVNRRKDGRLVVLETNGVPVLDAQGKLAGYRGVDRDITERKRAEEALQESEERYRILLEHGFDGVFVHENFRIVQMNDRFAEMTGYTRDELLNSRPIDLFTPESQERIRQYIRLGEVAYVDLRLRRRDGRILELESFGASCKFQGRDARIVGLRDITERKRAAEALREKEYLLSESQRLGHIGTWSVDLVANTATWTRETYRLFGISPETFEPTAETMLSRLHPDDRGAMQEWMRAALAGERPDVLEFRVILPDGTVRMLSGQGELIVGDDNKPLRLVGTAQDVTERRQTEETLRASETRFRSIVNSSPLGMHLYELREDGRLVFLGANPAADKILGVSHTRLIGKTIEEAFPGLNQTEVPARYREAARRGTTWRTEQIDYDEGGIRGAFEVVAFQTEPDKMVVVFNDITERKQAEETLREKEYLLSESQRIAHIGTWSMNLATHVLSWTPETYRLYGASPETFVPSSEALIGLLHPDDRGAMREWIRAALAREHPDVLELILDGGDELGRLVGTVQDVTEERQAEAALRELSRKNEEALRVARMGHWEFDLTTGTFLFNDQYYTLHGATAQEAGGYRMSVEEFARRYVHPDDADQVQEAIRGAATSDDPDFQFQTEARILRVDGEVRWVTVWFRIEKDSQGRTIKMHGVNQDVTERHRAEEALHRLNEHLEQLVAQRTEDLTHTVARLQQLTWELSQAEDRERKRIADLLHDDVQQILAGARFHLNLLSIEARSPEETQEIIRQVRQMLREAIEKARSLSHELSPALYQVGLVDILTWLAGHMQRKHGLIVHVKTCGQVDSSSEALKALLYKVAQELLFNVVKHAGVKEATICLRRMGKYIVLAVIDRGQGFDPREFEGTAGFGLLSIRERIHPLGGRMKITSTRGRGSRILIVIPDEGPPGTAVQTL
jgi:PAS domain S-box-containing protein